MMQNTATKIGVICGFVVLMTMAVFALTAFSNAIAAPAAQAQPQFNASSFNHLKTGFPLTGVHSTVRCETCHKDGVFKGTPKNCAGCHSVSTRVVAMPKTTNHVQTNAPCDYCHTNTTTFSGAKFNHTGISTGCATCHNGITAVGKSVSHIITAASCETCHTNKISFTGVALFNHVDGAGVSIISGCAACHNGSTARGKSAAHIPTTSPCESCHTNTTSFLGARFNHLDNAGARIISGCATCHNGSTARGKSATHYPVSTTPCESCHKSTISFLGALFDHNTVSPAVTGRCGACHQGQYAAVTIKPAIHIPVSGNACDSCHTSLTSFTSWVMNHTGLTSSCATCHSGQYTGVVSKSTSHIPLTPPTPSTCESCHSSTSSFAIVTMNHAGITSGCTNCHLGQYTGIVSKPAGTAHIPLTSPTPSTCESCHNSTTTFATWKMNHTGITSGCATCHGGQYSSLGVVTKSPTHLATSADCGTCHKNTTTFLSAIFDHSGIATAGVCSNCHDGVQALGRPPGHMVTAASCETCHTGNANNFTSFRITTFNHSGIVVGAGTCTNGGCHNSGGTGTVPGGATKPSSHITTTASCDACHNNTTSFLVAAMNHTAAGTVTAGVCGTCHGSSSQYSGVIVKIPAAHIPVTGNACDSCHKSFTTFAGALFNHASVATASVCGTCHLGQYTGVMSKPVAHIPVTTTGNACDTCHTSTTSFAVWTMSHAAVPTASACGTCHMGQYPGVVSKPAIHIPVTATGNACDSCHSSTTTPGGFSTWLMNHAVVPTAGVCSTCHGGQYPGVVSKANFPSHLVTTADCGTCHTGFTTFLGATGMHTSPPPAGTCYGCHGGGTPGGVGTGGGKAISVGHIPTGTVQCDTCHTWTSFRPNTAMNHTAVAATRCDACHNGSYTSQGSLLGGAKAKTSITNHIPTTITGSLDCNTCHKSTANWTTETMNHNAAVTGCVVCHLTGTTYKVPADFKRKSHFGASAAKDCSSASCHRPLGTRGTPYSAW